MISHWKDLSHLKRSGVTFECNKKKVNLKKEKKHLGYDLKITVYGL